MSSDNYMLIRKVGQRFGVTMEFASDEVIDFEKRARWFATADDAIRYASGEYTEYGMTFEGDNAAVAP